VTVRTVDSLSTATPGARRSRGCDGCRSEMVEGLGSWRRRAVAFIDAASCARLRRAAGVVPSMARDKTLGASECAAAATRHGPGMSTNPAPRSVDSRRQLLPRDYLAEPMRFGVDGDVELTMPFDGDQASFEIARLVHRLAIVARQSGRCGAQLGRRFQFSRQVFSDVLNGRRWPNASTLAALTIHAIEQDPPASVAGHPRSSARSCGS
jgi:hypothetical protein